MRQAIITKYLEPTNTRGGRVKARCEAGSLTVSWDHTLSTQDNHAAAARALCEKLGWAAKDFIGGGLKNAYVFVDTKFASNITLHQ